MFGFIIRQLRHRPGRGVGLGAGILVAASGFCLLTSAVDTEQAKVHATVDANLWPAYDILVRPAGTAASSVPTGVVATGLVPDTYLSGIYGGITEAQDRQISRLAGVGVAAPVAVLGYVLEQQSLPIDVTKYVSNTGDQLLRLSVTRSTDNGASVFPSADETYLLLTDKNVDSLLTAQEANGSGDAQTSGSAVSRTECTGGLSVPQDLEHPYQDSSCFMQTQSKVQAYLAWSIPLLVAGIDPVAENKLDGLGGAVTTGRYLTESDAPKNDSSGLGTTVPVLAGSTLYSNDEADVRIESVDPTPVLSHAGNLTQDGLDTTVDAEHGSVLGTVKLTEQDAYDQLLTSFATGETQGIPPVDAYWTAGQASVAPTAGGIAVKSVAKAPDDTWDSIIDGQTNTVVPPIDVQDTAFRGLTAHEGDTFNGGLMVGLDVVGTFNSSAVDGSSSSTSTQTSLNVFSPANATGADSASRTALGGKPLEPNSNLAGYLQQPPTLLTTINALSAFGASNFDGADESAPISVIRVKVSGLTGTDRQKLSRVAQVAYEIHEATGLTTDVMAGSSSQNVDVSLPAGKYRRPALSLTQPGTGEGVGVTVLDAVDRMSLLLFLVVLLATGLFLANGVNAAVRARRHEIGVLRALGWGRGAVFRSVLGEVALLGAIAGAVGTVLSLGLVSALSLKVPLDRVALVTPVAMVLSVGAGWLPAWRAARGRPTDVITGSAANARRAPGVHGVPGMVIASLLRAPWRAATGAAALGISVVTLSILLSLNARFGGQIGNSALSDIVDLQAKSIDYLSAAFAVFIGAASVADTVYLGMRERAAEFAVLTAQGWRRRHVARVALGEALAIGLVGAVSGAVLAIALGGQTQASITAAAAGVLVVLLAAATMLAIPRVRPTALILAEED
jgi:ABC-type antimicrobial peptide transport system permease subunit